MAKILDTGGIGDSGNQTLYVKQGDTEYQLLYTLKDYYVEGADSFEISGDAKPSAVSNYGVPVQIYPGINTSMNASEMMKIIPQWDLSKIYALGHISTIAYIEDYTLEVAWIMKNDFYYRISEELNGKNDDESKTIKQKYADEFVNYMATDLSKIRGITISHNKYKK